MLRGLHKLCDKGSWAEAADAISREKSDPTERGGWGDWTPLHLACRRDPPVSIVDALIHVAPETAAMPDGYSRLPIHHAAERGADVDVLAVLADAYPEGIIMKDSEGRVPLHLSILGSNRERQQRRNPIGMDEVSILLSELIPEGAEESSEANAAAIADNEGNLPLHCACDNIDDIDPDVLGVIVESNPNAVLCFNAENHVPLHQAFLKCCEQPPSLDVVKILLADTPEEVCSLEDGDGRLALHCACKNFASFEVLQQLLVHNSAAASVQCRESAGGKETGVYPIDILEELRDSLTSNEEIEELNFKSDLLFAAYPNVSPYKSEPDRLERLEELIIYEAETDHSLSASAASVWEFLCTYPEDDEGIQTLYAQTVQRITASLDYECVRMLASIEVAGGTGEEALTVSDCANPKCAALLRPYFRFVDRFVFDPKTKNERACVVHETDTSLWVKALDWGVQDEKEDHARRVIIKFEKDKAKFLNESELYALLEENKDPDKTVEGIVPVICTFNMDRLGTPDEQQGDSKFLRDVSTPSDSQRTQMPHVLGISDYRYASVIPMDDGDLPDLIKNDVAGFDEVTGQSRYAQRYALQIAKSLRSLHEGGAVQRNLSLSSFVRIDDELCLRGLGAAKRLKNECEGGIIPGSAKKSFKTGALPPEMFAKITSEDVMSYCAYWASIMRDAWISNMLNGSPGSADVIESKINSYLGDADGISYAALQGRIENNAALWRKIKPRRAVEMDGSESFFVVRCFLNVPHVNQLRLNPLPYDLVTLSKAYDVWNYALLLFELVTGRTPFQVNGSGDLVRDDDFISLGSWKGGTAGFNNIVVKNDAVRDPLVRDLFRLLLEPSNKRPNSMEDVLNHPYFATSERAGTEQNDLRSDIIFEEDTKERTLLETRRSKKQLEDWTNERTTKLSSMIPVDVQVMFQLSTCMEWQKLCQAKDMIHPTCFALLPYQLGQGNSIDPQYLDVAKSFAMQLGDVILYNSWTGRGLSMEDKDTKIFADEQLSFITNMRQSAAYGSYSDSSAIVLCERILMNMSNSEELLSECLENFVAEPKNVAKKILFDVVEEYVDLHVCEDLVVKAKDAEKAFVTLLSDMVEDSTYTAKQLVHDKLSSLMDPSFSKNVMANAPKIDAALSNVMGEFVSSPVRGLKNLLSARVEDLLQVLDSSDHVFFYLIDEYSGSPVAESMITLNIKKDSEKVMRLLPGFYLSAKSVCTRDFVQGFSSFAALDTSHLEGRGWLRSSTCAEALSGAASLMSEFTLFQEILGLESQDDMSDLESAKLCLQYIKSFLDQNDTGKKYGGLQGLRVDELFIWSKRGREEEIKSKGFSELLQFAKSRRVSATQSLQKNLLKNDNVHNKNETASFGSIPGSPSPSSRSDSTTQLFPSSSWSQNNGTRKNNDESSSSPSHQRLYSSESNGESNEQVDKLAIGPSVSENFKGTKQEPNLNVFSFSNESMQDSDATEPTNPSGAFYNRHPQEEQDRGMLSFDERSQGTASTASTSTWGRAERQKQHTWNDQGTKEATPLVHPRGTRGKQMHLDTEPPEAVKPGLVSARSSLFNQMSPSPSPSFELKSPNRLAASRKDTRRRIRLTQKTKLVS